MIPAIETEVNEGKNFAQLRQIYASMILAAWYKKTLKDNLLNKVYSDQKKIAGVDANDPAAQEKIYQQYIDAFKTGVYNFIRILFSSETWERRNTSHSEEIYDAEVIVLADLNFMAICCSA